MPVHSSSKSALSSAKKEAPAPLVQKQDVKDVQKKEEQEEKPAAPSPGLNQNTLVVSKVSDIVKRAKEKGEHLLAYHVGSVSVEQLENGKFIFSSAKELDKSFQPKLKAFLEKETNTLWEIEQKEGVQNAPPSLKEQKKAFQSSIRKRLSSSPVVKEALKTFPQSEISNVRLSQDILEKDDVEQDLMEEDTL